MARKKGQEQNKQAYFAEQIKAAEQGNLEALHNVAAWYATGELPSGKDEAKAVELYTEAAERGHALSQYDLGFMLILGEGIEKDEVKGLWWMEQAAANECGFAARFLSDVYGKGYFGVEIDEEKSIQWARREQEIKR